MKTPLILLSGLLSNEQVWRHQVSHLNDIAEIKVLAATQDTPKKMVKAILDQAPEKFALAGHSMGGWLCLEVMKTAPSRVTKLCLLNTTACMDSIEKKSARQKMIQETESGKFQKVIQNITDYFINNPLIKNDVLRMFSDVGQDAFVNQQKAMLLRTECESVLSRINCPTLVIHAAKDTVFSLEEHQELANRIKGAKLAVIDDSGHMSPMEVPEAITAFLRFWLNYF